MELKIGYYPILDMTLALRQICCRERFLPFTAVMESIYSNLRDEDKNSIVGLGDSTHEWLSTMECFMEMTAAGISEPVESLLEFEHRSDSHHVNKAASDAPIGELLKSCWYTSFGSESFKHSKAVFEKASDLAAAIGKRGMAEFLLNISDRVEKVDEHTLKYKIIPEHFIDLNTAETVIVMPSIYASRTLTFWYKDNTYVFFVSLDAASTTGLEPSDMMLMTALALNDKTRLRMLRLLSERSYSTTELSELLNMNSSTISRHFKVLKDANFVDVSLQQGNAIYYTLRVDQIKRSMEAIVDYIRR